nr:hypothetical protein [Tanacetum cinerariifolium]
MGALLIVEMHGLPHEQAGLGQVVGQHEEEFIFENTVDALGQCVLVAVVAVGHGAAQRSLTQGRLVGIRAVLTAPVGVVDTARGRRPGLAHGLRQRGQTARRVQATMHLRADDFARKRIRDQAQIDRALAGRQIGDIAHVELVRGRWLWRVFHQIRVTAEAVVRGGRLGGARFGAAACACPAGAGACARPALRPAPARRGGPARAGGRGAGRNPAGSRRRAGSCAGCSAFFRRPTWKRPAKRLFWQRNAVVLLHHL